MALARVSALILMYVAAASGQGNAPSFRAERVLPSNSARVTPLAPGMMVSIYGEDLGPESACQGQADPHRFEPGPGETLVSHLIYPTELCGVQMFVGDQPAGLLYVQAAQINFKVPLDVPLPGTAALRVVFQNRSSARVMMPVAIEQPKVSVAGVARVGAPIWVQVDMPYGWADVVYPVSSAPADFGCNALEVRRRNGVLLLPRVVEHRVGAYIGPGNGCGNDLASGGVHMAKQGRLPLHVQYRLEQPGQYEVRYTRVHSIFDPAQRQLQSEWTAFEVLPAAAPRNTLSTPDPAELVGDLLPNLLATPNAANLATLLRYVDHPNDAVRNYASQALVYWPRDEVRARVAELIRRQGPSDALVRSGVPLSADLIEPLSRYLQSDDPVRVHGAILGLSRMLFDDAQHGSTLPAPAKAQAETALTGALEHIVAMAGGNPQMLNDYAVALGMLRGGPSHEALWTLVERGIAADQAMSVITWREDPQDLRRLGEMLAGNAKGEFSLMPLPHALHQHYGETALPYLRAALRNESTPGWLRDACARELVVAGDATGFAYLAESFAQKRHERAELLSFLRGQFPDLRTADESGVLAFLRERSR